MKPLEEDDAAIFPRRLFLAFASDCSLKEMHTMIWEHFFTFFFRFWLLGERVSISFFHLSNEHFRELVACLLCLLFMKWYAYEIVLFSWCMSIESWYIYIQLHLPTSSSTPLLPFLICPLLPTRALPLTLRICGISILCLFRLSLRRLITITYLHGKSRVACTVQEAEGTFAPPPQSGNDMPLSDRAYLQPYLAGLQVHTFDR